MEKLQSIVGINIIILITYTLVILGLTLRIGDASLISCWIMGAHGLINLIISIVFFVRGDKAKGKSFLLSTGIVWLIGLSTCGVALSTFRLH